MADPSRSEDEYEEVEVEYEDEEGEMVDEDEDDPDYSPGEQDELETEEISLEDEDGSIDQVSDTNAPYADAGEEPAEAGTSKGIHIGNPLKVLGKLRPRELVAHAKNQRKRLQRLLWRLEDASVSAGKLAVKVAVRGARPLLVWLIVARTLRTIDKSEDLCLRMMRQPTNKQLDYYYSNLLGKDWEKQLEEDFKDALAEVDAGYLTDEMVRERRGLQAAIMRRLEVEEWDKERMKHFYYGLYGLGPWYWDMEERLHNPFFIGARGWNGPPESWINENQVFPGDMDPAAQDFRFEVAEALGSLRGKPLDKSVVKKLVNKEQVRAVDQVLASPVFKGTVDPLQFKQEIEEKQQQQQQTAAA